MNRKIRRADIKNQRSDNLATKVMRSPQLIRELEILIDKFSRGLLGEAEKNALHITSRYVKDALGWKLLGTIYTVQGRHLDSLVPLKRSTRLAPDDCEVYNSLGVNQQALGHLDDAVVSFKKALLLNPQYVDARVNLGLVFQSLGRFEEAYDFASIALTLRPDFAEGHRNLAIALQSLGRDDEAISSLMRAVQLSPKLVSALNSLALALVRTGRVEESLVYYDRLIEIEPTDAVARNDLGHALSSLGRVEEATDAFKKAIALKPEFTKAYSNLGYALKVAGKFNEAIEALTTALEIDTDFAYAHHNLGTIYSEQGSFSAAIASLRKAVELEPNFHNTHSNLLFVLQSDGDIAKAECFNAALNFGRSLPPINFTHQPRLESEPKSRLRVGFVSYDLRNHAVAFFLENILSALADRQSCTLEIVLYSTSPVEDKVSDRLRALCTRWCWVKGMSDEALARKIYEDEIDILIDLSGHTEGNRLPMFALKPAPIQASWIGYFATTGVPAMDYFLSDKWLAPPSEDTYFTEKLWRLRSNACFTPPDADVHVESIPALANGYVTFGCFNRRGKLTPRVIALWAEIMIQIPSSRLFLKSGSYGDVSVRTEIIKAFAQGGVGVDRLIFEGPSPREEYLACYNRVDICLDPFPYPGGTTTIEALWMGTPVLTMKGDSYLSRVGECAAQHIGAPNWIANDRDDYLARAIAFAADIDALAAWSANLRGRTLNSPLFDAKAMAQNFEEAMWGMWEAQASSA